MRGPHTGVIDRNPPRAIQANYHGSYRKTQLTGFYIVSNIIRQKAAVTQSAGTATSNKSREKQSKNPIFALFAIYLPTAVNSPLTT